MLSRKYKNLLMISMIFLLSSILMGCTPVEQNSNDDQTINGNAIKTVYTSFYPIYDFTSKIAGEKMNVELIIPAGAEPHDFEISPKMYTDLDKADLIIINGLGIESFAEEITNSIRSEKLLNLEEFTDPLIFKDNTPQHSDEDAPENNRIKYDPHVWLDPVRAMAMSEAIYDSLSKTDPDNQSYYRKNYEELNNKLMDLDKEYSELADIKDKKQIIVSHNAFSYLAERYGLTFTSISGISSEHEPSLKDISKIIDIVKAYKINTVFLEELSNEKIADIISSETTAEVDVLYTIEGMTPQEIESGEDYFYKMNLNLEKIKNAVN